MKKRVKKEIGYRICYVDDMTGDLRSIHDDSKWNINVPRIQKEAPNNHGFFCYNTEKDALGGLMQWCFYASRFHVVNYFDTDGGYDLRIGDHNFALCECEIYNAQYFGIKRISYKMTITKVLGIYSRKSTKVQKIHWSKLKKSALDCFLLDYK